MIKSMTGYGCADKVYLDFSIAGETEYYNGVIFKGFVDGIPAGVLSGGRYDKLLHRMKRSSKAVGFAVYLVALAIEGECVMRLCTDTENTPAVAVLAHIPETDAGLLQAVIIVHAQIHSPANTVILIYK